jgi:hypothetical protein
VAETYAFVQLFLGTSSEGPSLLGFNSVIKYVSLEKAWWLREGGLTENGWVGHVSSPGTLDFGTGLSSIGKIGFPVFRSKRKTKSP